MHKHIPRFLLGVLAVLGAHALAAAPNRMILPDDVVPEAYRIAITPHMAESRFEGSVEIVTLASALDEGASFASLKPKSVAEKV